MNIKYEEKESAPRKPTISLEEHSQTARKCQSLNNLKYICITCRHFTGFPPFKKQPAGTQNLIKQSCRLCYDSNRRLSFWGGFFTVEGGKLEQRDGLGETILCHAMHCLEGNRLFLPSSLVGWLTFYSFLFFFYVRFSLYSFIFILLSLGLAVNDYKIYRSRLRIGLYPDCRRITSIYTQLHIA